MQSITWKDEMGHRSRAGWLLLVKGGVVRYFTQKVAPKSEPGLLAVVGQSHVRNGKWSHTVWTLAVADGVKVIEGKDGWNEGTFIEGLSASLSVEIRTWADLAVALGVSLEEAQRFLREWRPKASENLDAVDAALASL